METKNIKLTLAYDGTRYHGWQRQKNGLSIQEVVETCLEKLTQSPVAGNRVRKDRCRGSRPESGLQF